MTLLTRLHQSRQVQVSLEVPQTSEASPQTMRAAVTTTLTTSRVCAIRLVSFYSCLVLLLRSSLLKSKKALNFDARLFNSSFRNRKFYLHCSNLLGGKNSKWAKLTLGFRDYGTRSFSFPNICYPISCLNELCNALCAPHACPRPPPHPQLERHGQGRGRSGN